jgi:hypothetical protein
VRAWTPADDELLRVLHARCAQNGRSVAVLLNYGPAASVGEVRARAHWVSVAAVEGADPFAAFSGPRGHCTEHAEHDLAGATTEAQLRRALRQELQTRRAAAEIRVGPL